MRATSSRLYACFATVLVSLALSSFAFGVGFVGVKTFNVGTSPLSVATGDFNGDGKIDVAVANSAGNNVSVLLGNGDGTFQTAVNYNVGATPFGVVTGDFNSDGDLDLAVVNDGASNVSILLGNGNGT